MTPNACHKSLLAALSAAVFDPRNASPRLAMDCFIRACTAGIGSDGNGLLVEWGTYSFTGPDLFSLSFVRQFENTGEDEYTQLRFKLYRQPDAATTALASGLLWSFDFQTAAEFAATVETLPGFKSSLSLSGWTSDIYIDQT